MQSADDTVAFVFSILVHPRTPAGGPASGSRSRDRFSSSDLRILPIFDVTVGAFSSTSGCRFLVFDARYCAICTTVKDCGGPIGVTVSPINLPSVAR